MRNPLPNKAYGISNRGGNQGPINSTLYDPSTPIGSTREACCNECYFGSQNCVQATYHDDFVAFLGDLGCRINLAPAAVGDGLPAHETENCPSGVISGLIYGPGDGYPMFIPGPCGEVYQNLR